VQGRIRRVTEQREKGRMMKIRRTDEMRHSKKGMVLQNHYRIEKKEQSGG
jgi:hypothetical protein